MAGIAQTELDFDVGIRQFWNVRDVSMAESLRWIREREGSDASIVVGAHNTHLQLHPVRVQRATSMGSYYSSRFGREDTLFIGAASERSVKGEPPRPDSNQAAYSRFEPDCLFLDLHQAPHNGAVSDWLNTERPDRSNLRYQPVCAGNAWDCLVFHRTLTTGEVELPDYLQSLPVQKTMHEFQRFSWSLCHLWVSCSGQHSGCVLRSGHFVHIRPRRHRRQGFPTLQSAHALVR